MINLLPPATKRELKRDEWYRLFLIIGISFAVFFIVLALLLLSVKIYIQSEVSSKKIILDTFERELTKERQTVQEIRRLNTTLNQLDGFYARQRPLAELIEYLEKDIPSTVFVTSFVYTANPPEAQQSQGRGKLSFRGVAPTRELFVEFRKNLIQDAAFKNVVMPFQNAERDIEFSVTLDIVL